MNGKNTAAAIEQALQRAWLSGEHTIQMTADNGKVNLAGTVRTPHDRLLAEQIAWAAPGTMNVLNDIIIL